jgi:hypothetical protein
MNPDFRELHKGQDWVPANYGSDFIQIWANVLAT